MTRYERINKTFQTIFPLFHGMKEDDVKLVMRQLEKFLLSEDQEFKDSFIKDGRYDLKNLFVFFTGDGLD